MVFIDFPGIAFLASETFPLSLSEEGAAKFANNQTDIVRSGAYFIPWKPLSQGKAW